MRVAGLLLTVLLLLARPAAAIDLVALQAELQNASYNGLSDAAAAAKINTTATTVGRAVNGEEIRQLLYGRGKWGAVLLRARAVNPAQAEAIGAAQALVDFANFRVTLPLDDSVFATQLSGDLAALVGSGDLSNADRSAVLALSAGNVALWQRFGGRPLDFNDVKQARGLP